MSRTRFRAGDRDKARNLFRALPRSVRKATAVALDSAANEVAEAIKRAVPVDRGELRESVKVKRGLGRYRKEAAGREADVAVRVTEGDKRTFYAPFVEFGTQDTPAQPHFWPTWRASRRRIVAKIRRAQRKAIRDAEKSNV